MKPGSYGDGSNLYLRISPTGLKTWLFVYTPYGQRREIPFGQELPSEEARAKA
jgi:Arm domain-containing DNA-binding protein